MPTPNPDAPRLLRSTVQSLGPPEQNAEAMTREQGKAMWRWGPASCGDSDMAPQPQPHSAPFPIALLYLFVLHDHDRSGHLDGLELLQLLGAVLAQDGEQPDPNVVCPTEVSPCTPWSPQARPSLCPTPSLQVAALVDRALERQDLSRDGLLDPPELLLSPGQGQGPLGQPLLQLPGDPLAGAGAAPGGDVETHGGDIGVDGPGHGLAEGQAAPLDGALKVDGVPELEAPNAAAIEAEEAPEAGAPSAGAVEVSDVSELAAPNAEAIEAEEGPEARVPAGEAAPIWEGPGEG